MDNTSAGASSGETYELFLHDPHSELWIFSSRWVYTPYCIALWDWMSALDNFHYIVGHHYKWLSPRALFKDIGGRFEPG